MTWRTLAADVRLVAAGLADLGIQHGDAIALMMTNQIGFYPVGLAAQHLGATPFSVYNTLSPDQISHILRNAGCAVVVCEAQYVETIRASGVSLEHLVVVDGEVEHALTLDDVRARGRTNRAFDFDATWRAVGPSDVLTLIYTSGTTGTPKGVELTHSAILAQAAGLSNRPIHRTLCSGDLNRPGVDGDSRFTPPR